MLFDELNGKEIQKRGAICIYIAVQQKLIQHCKATTYIKKKRKKKKRPKPEKAKLIEIAEQWLPMAGSGVPGEILMKEYKLPTVNK